MNDARRLLAAALCATFASDGAATAQAGDLFVEPSPTTPSPRWTSPPYAGSWLEPTWHALGLMSVMRVSAAVLWPEPFAETDPEIWLERYVDAFSSEPEYDADRAPFEWDGDRWTINVIGHGLFGSELYLRPRICRQTPVAALAFAAAGAATWEYVFEGNAVHPSGLDLWFTPLAGLLLGEARFQAWSAAGDLDDNTWRTIVQSVLDPLGELERALGAGC